MDKPEAYPTGATEYNVKATTGDARMKEWGFAQNHPNEELALVHLFSMNKQQAGAAACRPCGLRPIDRLPCEGK
jgi:hypothetical protein